MARLVRNEDARNFLNNRLHNKAKAPVLVESLSVVLLVLPGEDCGSWDPASPPKCSARASGQSPVVGDPGMIPITARSTGSWIDYFYTGANQKVK